VKLSDDTHLLNGLILHLRPTINRLKYGLTLKNPILDEIKLNYPELYGAAWMTSIVFERYVGVRPGEEEIGYIALHLGAALERARKPLRALVVCTSGIGTSELIAARLVRCFHEIEIVEVLSTTALKNYSLDAIDVIISTVPVETAKPVITVSPLLTQNDIKLLTVCLEKLRAKPKVSTIPIHIEYVQPETGLMSREKIIRYICSRLQKLDFVSSAFVRDAIQREKKASTYLGNLSALPHASPQFAKQPVLAVCRLPNPVDWGGAPVDFILLLVLPEDSSDGVKQFLRALYRKLCYPEFIEKLRRSETIADIIHEMEDVLC
jgi:mannitol/fructose-specific phosphotransferase system IIA component (Ntr-type)/galactitol-specific phosphotransferase system IIB component